MKPLNNLLFITLLWFLPFSTLHAQILKNVNLNLNSGGRINDVEFIESFGVYVVVGDFDSINGTSIKNVAFLKADFTIHSNFQLSNINGEVRSVEYEFTSNRHYLWFGGNFESIIFNGNNYQRNSIIETYLTTSGSSFLLNLAGFNPLIDDDTYNSGIYGLEFSSPYLYLAGDFYQVSSNIGGSSSPNNPFIAVRIYNNLLNRPLQTVNFNGEGGGSPYYALNKGVGLNVIGFTGNPDYSYPKRIQVFNNLNLVDSDYSFIPIGSLPCTEHDKSEYYRIICIDSLIHTHIRTGMTCSASTYINPPEPLFLKLNPDNTIDNTNSVQIADEPYDFVDYNKYILYTSYSNGNVSYDGENKIIELKKVSPSGTVNNFGYYRSSQNIDETKSNLHTSNNFLFVSESNMLELGTNILTSLNQWGGGTYTEIIGPVPHIGLAIFCLEPNNPKDFTVFDQSICEGNIRTYTIPAAQFATGYKWTYTGTGATYRVAGTSDALQPLTSVIISNVNAKSIEIHFGAGTTGGTLTVEPFCTCNTTTDYLYSTGKSLVLTAAPLPNISMVDTMNFTCITDTLLLQINSSTSGISYNWKYNNDSIGSTSDISINKFDNGTVGYYYGTVMEPINQCSRTDSTFVAFDTLAAEIFHSQVLASSPFFTCLTDSITLDGLVSNALISWATTANPINVLPSSLTIYSIDTLNLIMFATYNSNGCTAQTAYSIIVDQTTSDGALTGYPNYPTVQMADTINCFNSNLALTCEVIGSEPGTAQWLINNTLSGDQLILNASDSVGMDSFFNTKVFQFQTLNSSNGCIRDYNVVIVFDLESPFAASNEDESLNCSQSSVILNHLATSGNVLEGWLDETLNQTGSQSLLVSNIGEYYYQVKDTINGCIAVDTVNVIQTSELLLDLVSDTLVCPNQQVNLTVAPINNSESCTFNWSNGSQNQSITAIGGVDTELSVVVTNASGCVGYDTVSISITPPVLATFDAVSSCTSGAIQITTATGGSGNYSYSLDAQNWQTNTAFTDLTLGNYTIYVKDDLGCVYSFNETLDGNGAVPDLNFLVSTYNEIGDTIALVNISGFTGFDSLIWSIPAISTVLSVEDSLLILSIDEEGWFEVVLNGYIDTCMYSFKKAVYFGTESPLFDENYDTKGIDSLVVFPNPTTGFFTVEFTLGIEQNYTIVVTNLQGQAIASMSYSGTGNTVSKDFNFPLGTPPGNYSIHIIADFDAAHQSIILSY